MGQCYQWCSIGIGVRARFISYIIDIDCAVDTLINKFENGTKLYGRVRTKEKACKIQSPL